MFIHVINARYCGEYKVWLSFNDGTEGEVDLASELYGQVFEPLKDKEFFKSFKLEGHTLSWVNGADFAPEFLYEQIASSTYLQYDNTLR
jgi:Protein of unknown function (DUF2442)